VSGSQSEADGVAGVSGRAGSNARYKASSPVNGVYGSWVAGVEFEGRY